MTLLAPIWLVLLIPVALAMTRWTPPSRWLRGLRWGVWLLLLAALAEPVLYLRGRGGVLVVITDRSESMPQEALQRQKPVIELTNKKRRAGDSLAVVAFRQQAAVEMFPGEAAFAGFQHDTGQGASNLHDALQQALDLIPDGGSGRIAVLSDGQWSGTDPAAAAARAALRGVAVDYQLQQRPRLPELAVVQFLGPEAVGRNEAFLLTAWYDAPDAGPVTYELERNGKVLTRGTAPAVRGRNRLLFRDQGEAVGVAAYTLRVSSAASDPVPENNTARLLVAVHGPRPLLCLSPTGVSGLAQTLRASGFEVVNRKPGDVPLTLAELSRYTAVILENVPARDVGTDSLYNTAAWVTVAGGGLMLTGGEQAYGQGGYMKSPVDPILPVSLELRREHRKMSLAIAVAMDRSGSMSMPAGNGRTKMDMANLGTAEVINLLSDFDHVGVVAVDSSAHLILPVVPVPEAKASLDRVLKIESMGGGIFIYEALKNAAAMLSKAPQRNKHIILFADASDSEEPGDYKNLLATCRTAGITVSVVGMGTETDCDAALLRDIAERGGGRVFFSARPDELPGLFAQETFAVTGSSFSNQPTAFQLTAAWLALGGTPLRSPPPLDGYNICFLKREALPAALTMEKEPTPVVAFWQAGSGRVLCFMGEADGAFGRQLAQWAKAGEFYATLARWTAGTQTPLPAGMLATRTVQDGLCVVDLYLDPERNTVFAQPPQVTLLRERPGQPPQSEVRPLHWLAPDQLRCELPLAGGETAVPVLALPDGTRVALPPACLPFSPEFAPPEPGRGEAALRKLAEATGGKEVTELSSLWNSLPRTRKPVPLRPFLFSAALVVFLVEVLQRRTGWLRWRRRTTAQAVAATRVATTGATVSVARGAPRIVGPAPPPAGAGDGAVAAPAAPEKPSDVFRQAKARADRFTRR